MAPKSKPQVLEAGLDWREWLGRHFAASISGGFSERHEEFWQWVWSIEEGKRPRPFVALWPRGGGKSSSAEMAVAAIGVRGKRRYCIYVCETQAQADDHVSAIAGKLEALGVERELNKYGDSKGWRRNRLRARGFTVDALGLDVASRGKKIDDDRPDLMVFDDIDSQEDSPKITARKKRAITRAILPAMAAGCAVLFVQNLIHSNSIASQLTDDRAGFLVDRIVSGPHPAVLGLVTRPVYDESLRRTRQEVVAGVPTWQGQDLQAAQEAIDTYGLREFLTESQQDVNEREGALWARAALSHAYREAPPEQLKRVVVGVDPSGGGDEIGIIVAGLGYDNHGYVLADCTVKGRAGTAAWGRAVVNAYHEWQADRVVVETNFGGDMVRSNIAVIDKSVAIKEVHASRGKAVRAEPVATLYGDPKDDYATGTVYHAGGFTALETELTTWEADASWSPNRLDALVWALTELMLKPQAPPAPASQPAKRKYFN